MADSRDMQIVWITIMGALFWVGAWKHDTIIRTWQQVEKAWTAGKVEKTSSGHLAGKRQLAHATVRGPNNAQVNKAATTAVKQQSSEARDGDPGFR